MGVRTTGVENKIAIFDSVSGYAFGPVFDDEDDALSYIAFAERLGGRDIRTLDAGELENVYRQWRAANRLDDPERGASGDTAGNHTEPQFWPEFEHSDEADDV